MLLSEECNSGCMRIVLLGCKTVVTALSRRYHLSSVICLQDIDRCILHIRCVCTDSRHVTVCLFCSSNANVTVHFCYIRTYSTFIAYCYGVSYIYTYRPEQKALLYSRTASGLQSCRLMALSALHALRCRLKQMLKQQKRVNSLPLKTFGTTSTKMDLEPSYDLLKSANPKSSCSQRVGKYKVAPFYSLSVAACLWQQLYCMSAKGSTQLRMPFMEYLYHLLQFSFTACLLC